MLSYMFDIKLVTMSDAITDNMLDVKSDVMINVTSIIYLMFLKLIMGKSSHFTGGS
jgi:hypothetical protein